MPKKISRFFQVFIVPISRFVIKKVAFSRFSQVSRFFQVFPGEWGPWMTPNGMWLNPNLGWRWVTTVSQIAIFIFNFGLPTQDTKASKDMDFLSRQPMVAIHQLSMISVHFYSPCQDNYGQKNWEKILID